MKLTFGEIIRKYRRERDLTQEELAQDIGISSQSVSKWERGEGYPDIMLLPVIARNFGVTIDELFGNDKTDEIIDGYERESEAFLKDGETEKDLALWEKACEEFPNDLRVMYRLMSAMVFKLDSPAPKEDAEKIIALGEKILARSTDQHQREGVISDLSFIYSAIGNREKSLYYADMGGSIWHTGASLRLYALDGEEAVVEGQNYLSRLIQIAAMNAKTIAFNLGSSPKEKIEAHQFAVDILERLYSDGNVGFYSYDLSTYNYYIAVNYAKMQDGENTIKALENSRRYAVISATLPDELDYTAPLVNRMKFSRENTSKNYKGNACNLRLEDLKDSRFDFIRENDCLKAIVSDLEKYAEQI